MEDKDKVKIEKEKKQKLVKEIQAYFIDNYEEEIGELKAELLIDFLIEKVGKEVYNQALYDSKYWFKKKLEDLESDFFTLEK